MRLADHPPLLRVLLLTELGERFGAYLLFALLTIYLTERIGWSAGPALRVNGAFLALCYGLAVPAGCWADRARAHSTAITAGCALMTAGYLFLAIGSSWACLAGLLLLAVGSGLFKPSMPALIGELYAEVDPRKEEAFTLFYASANLGALFAPPIGEWLRRNHGWAATFGFAALVQLGAMASFRGAWRAVSRSACQKRHPFAAEWIGKTPGLPRCRDERRRLHTFLFLTALSLWFWIGLQQTSGSLMLFARDHTIRYVKIPLSTGWKECEIPVGWLASIHAGLVIVLAPLITTLWSWRRRTGQPVSGPGQMAWGMALLALAYGSLILPISSVAGGRIEFGWLLLCYTALSLAEVCVGPLGYSLVSQCAPTGYAGMLMGAWLAVTALGSFLAGEMGARLWTRWAPQQFFTWLAVGSIVCAVLAGTQRGQRPRSLRDDP